MTWQELNQHKIVIYSTPWCVDCKRLKIQLDAKNINYTEIDIDQDEAAAKYLQEKTGRTAIPYVEIDGKNMIKGWHEGFPSSWDEETFLNDAQEAIK